MNGGAGNYLGGEMVHPRAWLGGARSCTRPGLSSGTLGCWVDLSVKKIGENLSFHQVFNTACGREVGQTLFMS